jgi:hypothetical protein
MEAVCTDRIPTPTKGCCARTERFKKVENAPALIWKILRVAESTSWRLKGAELLPAVYAGAQCVDGVGQTKSADQQMAA